MPHSSRYHTRTALRRICLATALAAEIMSAGSLRTVPGTDATIAGAVAAAASGDTIMIGPGTYQEQVVIAKDLTLIGSGIDQTILREAPSNPDSTILIVNGAHVELRGVQFYGSASWQGGRRGLMALNASTVLRQCAFVQCFNVSVAAVNGSLDADTVLITCSYGGPSSIVIDSAEAGQSGSASDLGIQLVNAVFQIGHLTAGAQIDHIINIQPDFTSTPGFLGTNYPIDGGQYAHGTIENSVFYGSRAAYYGQGIRIFGSVSAHQPEVIIRGNRFKGQAVDSSAAMPNMLTTAGISFNGWNGYAEIYGNTIQRFNSGITIYGISSASIHDNTISDNARYGIVTSWSGTASQSDLGGGAYGSAGNNRIYHNGQFNIYHRNAQPLSAVNNFWGTTDPAVIGALIFDHSDDASVGIVNTAGFILPVELTTFTAAARPGQGGVLLQWTTATETGNAGFSIERMRRGAGGAESAHNAPSQAWTPVGFVEGHGTSAIAHDYAFTDRANQGSYAYRLKQIDQNGAFRYSSVLNVEVAAPAGFVLEQNYPNPFNPTTTFEFGLPTKSHVTLTIFDIYGRKAAVIVSEELPAGTHIRQWNASGLSSGVYVFRLQAGSYSASKRLLLLK